MKKIPISKLKKTKVKRSREIEPEYEFDYRKAKSNRFAGRIQSSNLVVTIDQDVSKIFIDSESVNHALRTIMHAVPNVIKKKLLSANSKNVLRK